MEYPGGAGFHAAAHGGHHSGAGGHALTEAAACGVPPPEQISGRSSSLWRGDHAGAGDLPGTAAHGGHKLEQFAPDGWTPWYRPISGAVLEELMPVGSPCRISSGRTASRGRDPTAEGKRVTKKEQQKPRAINRPQPPFLRYPLPLRGTRRVLVSHRIELVFLLVAGRGLFFGLGGEEC